MNVTFDVETTGLIPNKAKWDTDYNIFPHIVQLAWKCSDEKEIHDFIIQPDGWIIPEESTKIHGITNDEAEDKGHALEYVLNCFLIDCEDSIKVIGHNIHFDTSIIKANILRITKDISTINRVTDAIHKSKRIDTMMKTIKFCNIKQPNSKRYKFPSLVELHNKLFNESFEAHNAKYDVLATERCYDELVKLGVI